MHRAAYAGSAIWVMLTVGAVGCGSSGAVCGNQVVEDGEDCDDGDDTNEGTCPAGCVAQPEGDAATCADMLDNDLDAFADCEDADCADSPPCQPVPTMELDCDDCLDADQDTLFDCADPDCAEDPLCGGSAVTEDSCAACTDGADNDGNSFVDCLDFSCRNLPDGGSAAICP